jgi:dolichol-phosphate mannosyltransferase
VAEPAHIAVIVPCYNEAAHIAGVVAGLPALVRTVIVVDDHSSDATPEALAAIRDPRVVAIRHERNTGVGGAMLTGYREALRCGADICVKMDGDGQMSPDDLPALLRPLLDGEADYAKGNRFQDLDALARMPRLRLIGNGVLSFLTKLVSGYWSIFDPTNGYTAIRRATLAALPVAKIQRQFFFETSMLVELNITGAVVRDVVMPARYGDERSSLRVGAVLRQFPPLLVLGLTRRFFWRYMIRDFNVLTLCVLAGLPALVFGAGFGAYHWWKSIVSGVPATAGTTILSALPIILGFQCLLVAFILDVLYQPSRRGAGA